MISLVWQNLLYRVLVEQVTQFQLLDQFHKRRKHLVFRL